MFDLYLCWSTDSVVSHIDWCEWHALDNGPRTRLAVNIHVQVFEYSYLIDKASLHTRKHWTPREEGKGINFCITKLCLYVHKQTVTRFLCLSVKNSWRHVVSPWLYRKHISSVARHTSHTRGSTVLACFQSEPASAHSQLVVCLNSALESVDQELVRFQSELSTVQW